jgi:tRNA G18 (ribose-2'-O)-methylase SpoU
VPSVVPITSLEDPRVAVFRDVRDRDLRNAHGGLFMAESEPVIRRLLETPERVQSLLLTPVRHASLGAALEVLPADVPVYVGEPDVVSAIAGFHLHRGALAAGRRRPAAARTLEGALGPLRDRARLRLVLAEGLNNVDNMGALFRNAAAFGVDGIVVDATSCDPEYRKSIRVSMGHVLTMPWAVSADLPADLERLRAWGVTVVAAETTPDARPVGALPDVARIGVLFGNEWEGISPAALAACDGVYAIPMRPGVPSLNVATASAVVLYELDRHG